MGVVVRWSDEQVQRYILQARYGYIGLTVVADGMRGRGVGSALTDAVMGWFAEQRTENAFLHYVADNPLSSRFWPSMGFTPYHEILAQSW